jgi:hypothetical protein
MALMNQPGKRYRKKKIAILTFMGGSESENERMKEGEEREGEKRGAIG